MMQTPVLICDDSSLARKQMARSIPDGWDVSISFAENGQQALEKIRQGLADVMFLDLNMPVMDGYETMQYIKEHNLDTLVIVVSGDVQPEARSKMKALGALDFIEKPIDNDKLTHLLSQYGIYSGKADSSAHRRAVKIESDSLNDKLDICREITNVAIGSAGKNLARVLNEFIALPVPKVNVLDANELSMALSDINYNDTVSAVSIGFASPVLKGEGLIIFSNDKLQPLYNLLHKNTQARGQAQDLEVIIDITNIIIGAIINALAEQLHLDFSQSHPIVLGRNQGLNTVLASNLKRWNKLMAIEIAYRIDRVDIGFELLLLFPEQALDEITKRYMIASDNLAESNYVAV